MIEKTYSLLGLRKSTLLFHIRRNDRTVSQTIIRELTPELEEQCENKNLNYIHISDKFSLDKRHILLYGEIDLNSPIDIQQIKEFCYIPEDYDAYVHSNFNYDFGEFTTIGGIAKSHITYDPLLWFKYNYCLIGKPKKILIYKRYATH